MLHNLFIVNKAGGLIFHKVRQGREPAMRTAGELWDKAQTKESEDEETGRSGSGMRWLAPSY